MIRRAAHILTCLVTLLAVGWAHAGEISEISVTGDTEYTRITFVSNAPVDQKTFLIATPSTRGLDLKLENSVVTPDAKTPPPTGGIDSYEIRDGEIIFNLTTPMMVSRAMNLSPTTVEPRNRLVVDLVRVAPVRFDRAAARDDQEEVAYASSRNTIPRQQDSAPAFVGARPDKYVVVIDPGHGGKDPGASSHNQKREKAIVLDTALQLQAKLEQDKRYEVHLTRDTDVYVDHEVRVSMARNWGADLFISVHADAAGNSSVSGATVYTLSARGERRVDGTAKTNGWDLPIEDGTTQEVSGILADLIKRETKSNSAIFAEALIPELAKAGPIVRNSHRQENFFVLLAPDVPAVLVEVGFLTNRSDVARLTSSSGRKKTADAIARAIDTYFDQRDLLYAAN